MLSLLIAYLCEPSREERFLRGVRKERSASHRWVSSFVSRSRRGVLAVRSNREVSLFVFGRSDACVSERNKRQMKKKKKMKKMKKGEEETRGDYIKEKGRKERKKG